MEAIPAEDAWRKLYESEDFGRSAGSRSATTLQLLRFRVRILTNALKAFLCVCHGPTRTNETTEAISNTKCTNPVMKSFRGPDKIRHCLIELVRLPVAPSAGQEGRAAVSEK